MDIELAIHLGDVPVGSLHVDRHDHAEFRLLPSYKEMFPRPVLGQVFEDDLDRTHSSTVRLPEFFSNLLPEGPLRELVAAQIGVKEIRESYLLAHLGEDLVGAVRAIPLTDLDRKEAGLPRAEDERPSTLRFSLAGVQLKFSMLQEGQRFTLPARDRQGDWIVKLPDARYARVPENEYSMLRWAAAAGIDTPEARIVPATALEGLPAGVSLVEPQVLAVRRFDRRDDGPRVHQEDFAQILNVYPREKYEGASYTGIAKIILRTTGSEDFEAFLDRLVFVIASGNADAHLKNWSLRYEDGITARLAPAYDLVATILYPVDDHLALKLDRSRRFEDVSWKSFDKLTQSLRAEAEMIGYDVARVRTRVQAAIERILDTWTTIRNELLLAPEALDAIERHWQRIPLLCGPVSPIPPRVRQMRLL